MHRVSSFSSTRAAVYALTVIVVLAGIVLAQSPGPITDVVNRSNCKIRLAANFLDGRSQELAQIGPNQQLRAIPLPPGTYSLSLQELDCQSDGKVDLQLKINGVVIGINNLDTHQIVTLANLTP
jgi:hypothetical protein